MLLPRKSILQFRLDCLLLFLLMACLTSCGKIKFQLAAKVHSAKITTPPWISEQPISNHEARIVAKQFKEATQNQNARAMSFILDRERLLSQVTTNTGIHPEFCKEFATGLNDSEIEKNLLAGLSGGGRIELIRIHNEQGETRALFRILPANGGLNYWDAILNKQPNGEITVVDLYNYLDGEKLSSQFRRLMFVAVRKSATRNKSDMADDMLKLKQAAERFQAGDHHETLQICKSLPAYLQNEKVTLVLRIQVASRISENECHEAINAFRLHYPDDPCLELLLLDYHILKGNFSDAIESLDRLDSVVDGDDYLDIVRTHLLAKAGKVDQAHELALTTLRRIPKEIDAYWSYATVQMMRGDQRGMVRTLNIARKRFGSSFNESLRLPKHAPLAIQYEARRRVQAITNKARKSFAEITKALGP